MRNGILSFNLLKPVKIVRISFSMKLKDLIVNIACKLPFDDIGKDFSFSLKLCFNRDTGQNFLVKAVNLADFEC
jgi:hypothetical protein